MNRGFWLVCAFCVIANAGAADGVVGPGNCDEAGFASVLATVDGSGGGTVTFDCGDDVSFAFTSYKTIQNAVTIDGANRITFDGGDASAFFDIPAGASLTLQHMIVQHGAFAGVHALENRGHLRLFDVRIILNTSTESPVFNYGRMDVLASTFGGNSSEGAGGAITNSNDTPGGTGNGGVLVVGFSSFEANASSATGGAIYNYLAATTLWGVTLNGNTATAGGAVDAFGSTVFAMNSTFADNHATSDAGGAIRVQETGLRVDNTNLVDNSAATNGGGISCEVEPTGFSSLYATTFAGNTAGGDGGGAYVDCDLTYADVTFNANTADGSGGAIAAVGANNVSSIDFATMDANTAHTGGGLWSDGAGAIAIGHSIVSANVGGNCEGMVTSNGYNLSDDAGCAAAFTATGDVLDATLPLMELGDYGGPSLTQPPASDSAAVDHIPVDACAPNPRWDERSALRPIGDACDSGAVELGGVVDFILGNSFESG
ncbi:MAG TPA: choice-of-anchor Q domain-containing protein [Rhodanobacteraceae bacterium]|nr:choice-of-anchor Q domain-containing protein [Rhodanobacteraceae bacterium]